MQTTLNNVLIDDSSILLWRYTIGLDVNSFSWYRSVSIYDVIRPWRSYWPVWIRAPCMRIIWRQIFIQAKSLYCQVRFQYPKSVDLLIPLYYAITRQKFNHQTPKKFHIFPASFRNTMPNFRANGSAVAEKNADRLTYTHTWRNVRFRITDVR